MQYLQMTDFLYDDAPSEQVVFFGRDQYGTFIHQVIRDKEIRQEETSLDDAVTATNESTLEFVAAREFTIEFGDVETQFIDGREYKLCKQTMTFPNGNMAVQENVYFYDGDNTLSMMQFGTSQLQDDVWEKNGDGLSSYVEATTKRMLSAMATNGKIMLPISTYSFVR